MNIKVQCNCGAKFSFDVEPVNGQMPCAIACPQCGADATAAANLVISQNLPAAQPVAVPAAPPQGLRVAGIAAAPAKTAAPPSATTTGVAPDQLCTRHPRKRVESHCYVCGKPICMDCMQIFGFLCSATCRYQAEQQGIKVPACEFKQSVAEARDWRKVFSIIAAIAVVLMVLAGAWIWLKFSGSHPKVYYSVTSSKDGWYTHGQFIDAKNILVVDEKQIAMHNIDEKKVVWTRPFEKAEDAALMDKPKVLVTADNIWVCLASSVLRLDLKTGDVIKTIPLKGIPTDVRQEKNELVIAGRSESFQESITHIDLTSGEAKTEDLQVKEIARTVKKRLLSQANPTQGVLLNEEFNEPTITGRERSEFIPAGDNIAEMQVTMLEEHFNEVQSIKPNKGPSKLDENVTAATPVAPVAEEILNDIARSRGGGFKTVDESRYKVVLRRNSKEIPEWAGEVIGPPVFFPSKTVDILTAGTGIWIFDKQNKLLKQDKLAHPVAEHFGFSLGTHQAPPCVEVGDTLYFYDQGVLTAFGLPAGDVRWRVQSVGISSVKEDGKGGLYVCTTSANPEDIQFTEQVKIQDRAHPVLMKVDAKSGKILWKANYLGVGCYLSDKFVYAINQQSGGGPGLAVGLAQALGGGGGGGGSSRFRLSRLDPDTGKELWGYYREGLPENLDFKKNRILLQYEDRIVVLKFLTF